jgi:hypothetical protein
MKSDSCAKTSKSFLFLLICLSCSITSPIRSMAQAGPKVQECYETTKKNGRIVIVAKHGACFVGRESDGSVNFIQWKHGTATTGLAVWKRRVDGKCFTLKESPGWSICAD